MFSEVRSGASAFAREGTINREISSRSVRLRIHTYIEFCRFAVDIAHHPVTLAHPGVVQPNLLQD